MSWWSPIVTLVIEKTQKDHNCEYCKRTIPKGSPDVSFWKEKCDNEIQSSYACHWCDKHSMSLVDNEGMIDFVERIIDMFEENKTIPGNCYFGGADGDYFIFKDRETDKEVKRVYCPIIKKEVE